MRTDCNYLMEHSTSLPMRAWHRKRFTNSYKEMKRKKKRRPKMHSEVNLDLVEVKAAAKEAMEEALTKTPKERAEAATIVGELEDLMTAQTKVIQAKLEMKIREVKETIKKFEETNQILADLRVQLLAGKEKDDKTETPPPE